MPLAGVVPGPPPRSPSSSSPTPASPSPLWEQFFAGHHAQLNVYFHADPTATPLAPQHLLTAASSRCRSRAPLPHGVDPARSSPAANMFGRGSPRISLIQASGSMQKSLSPRSTLRKVASPKLPNTQKKNPSPKVKRKRASWSAGLEKVLVDLLLEHNNVTYKGQNGWSSESWNRIVNLFLERFPHAKLTKTQIQDKEKELKRDYKSLKEARKQSGVHWNERLGMKEAEAPIWDNIIKSLPKAAKFQSKPFPLFESLGELYDGQIAEGTGK